METINNQRFVGMDLGSTAARLCFSTSDADTDEIDVRAILFEKSPHLPAVLAAGPAGYRGFLRRSDLARAAANPASQGSLLARAKDRLAQGSDTAERELACLAKMLADELKTRVRGSSAAALDYPVTVGISPEWSADQLAADALARAASDAGLGAVTLYPDACAAALYGIWTGDLPVDDGRHAYLVVDAAAAGTRFTLVEKPAGSTSLTCAATCRVDWGGDSVDRVLYENFLLPRYWTGSLPPDEAQRASLIMLVRELKERFAAQPRRGATMDFGIEGIADPVELTPDDFHSDEIGGALAEQVREMLEDPRIVNGPFGGAECLLLVGGSSTWDFLRQAIFRRVSQSRTAIPKEPDLAACKGLALVAADALAYRLAHPVVKDPAAVGQPAVVGQLPAGNQPVGMGQPAVVSQPPGGSPQVSAPAGAQDAANPWADVAAMKARFHRKARQIMLFCTIAGAVFALLVSPIPCAAWPVLLGLEAYMFYAIAKVYSYKLTSGLVWLLLGGLLLISGVLSVVVTETVSFLSAFVAAPIIKPVVAALVIWGLGEAAIFAIDRDYFKAALPRR